MIKIKKENIKSIKFINIEGGITYKEVMNKYKPDILMNLALYDVETKQNIVKMKVDNKASGYLFSDYGFKIENNVMSFSHINKSNNFIGGSPTLIQNGKINIDWGNKYSSYIDGVHVRSSIGINDNELILYCSDEKQSVQELSNSMLKLGCKFAINLDGGGSCHLQQGDSIFKKSTRGNVTWLLIYLKEKGSDIMKFNVHAGHGADGSKSCGAIGLIKESTEARKVKDEVIRLLKEEGHIVFDTTVDNPSSASNCINQIVNKCNKNKVDLDISIHFNAGANDKNGNGKSCGTEVLIYSDKSSSLKYANNVVSNISKLGFRNRGVKFRTDLGVLRSTKSPALLIECCFVDDKDDVELYNYKSMAKAIVEGILNKQINNSVEKEDVSNQKYGLKVFSFSSREKALSFQDVLKREHGAYSELYKVE